MFTLTGPKAQLEALPDFRIKHTYSLYFSGLPVPPLPQTTLHPRQSGKQAYSTQGPEASFPADQSRYLTSHCTGLSRLPAVRHRHFTSLPSGWHSTLDRVSCVSFTTRLQTCPQLISSHPIPTPEQAPKPPPFPPHQPSQQRHPRCPGGGRATDARPLPLLFNSNFHSRRTVSEPCAL